MKAIMKFSFRSLIACILSFVTLFIYSCNNEEIANSGDVNPETIFFDYHFSAAEEGGDIALKLQYRFGGPQGTTLVLEAPSQVTVDGQVVPVDSSGIDGAFYEVVKPFEEFTGQHQVVFTGKDGKTYEETVEFPVFRLDGVLPDTIGREDLELDMAGLDKGDVIQVMLTDTAQFSRGVEHLDSMQDGKIRLAAGQLEGLRSGPANFQLIRQRNMPLKQTTREGGRLSVSYSVSREVFIR